MNREVLFRGKRVDNGEWVYGGICDYGGGVSIFVVNHYEGSLYEPPYTDLDEVDVDPSTVGEFTGLYDKNGKRIWEGDICTIAIPRIDGGVNKHENCKCEFHDGVFTFGSDDGYWCRGNEYGYENTAQENIQVIGNIHENAELNGEDRQ